MLETEYPPDPDSKPTNRPKAVRLKSANGGGEEHERVKLNISSIFMAMSCGYLGIMKLSPIYLRPITESQNKFQNQSKTKGPPQKNNKRNCTLSKKPNRLSTFTRKQQQAKKKTGVQNAFNNKQAFFCLPPATHFLHRPSRLLSRLFPFLLCFSSSLPADKYYIACFLADSNGCSCFSLLLLLLLLLFPFFLFLLLLILRCCFRLASFT